MSKEKPFPFQVNRVGREDVQLVLPNGTEVLLCAHGASELARLLTDASKGQYCDGYRHGDESSMHIGTRNAMDAPFYTTQRIKPLKDLRASDVPRGLDPDDFTTD